MGLALHLKGDVYRYLSVTGANGRVPVSSVPDFVYYN
ncbi:hypothetical protein JMJ77_0000406 [Colletotrichum scovillei]|uniref:Uncharacterized protein n=1 Tax=Colletotrichum scovillei TaxID=1209932 RepID=A0A9P7R9H7_9PEZI|nr:hypothetical protein JMJ77_0000406 [Colletotrichum scovillei]KAG7071609.1 hypothetical protein JMJ76_0004480 [Colletotrichum scovillei]KAG7079861.1 hypothetical protein JMJ78_0006965 [Colletotrichum scovillei]